MSGLQSFLFVVLLFCVFASKNIMINALVVDLSACSPSQIQTLMEFKSEFHSSGCNHSAYVHDVECNNATGAVTKLQLPSGCLSGTLKPNSSLFRLHHLRYLNLSYNKFTSSLLPSGFGSFNRLEVLSLSSNGFIGQVPSSFSNLSQLSILDLSYNWLAGSFPLVRNLSKLYFLDLSYNQLTGTLNPNNGLISLHQLQHLDLSYNYFGSSSFPFEFGYANRLEVLDFSSSGFIGQVPTSFSNLSRLNELYLSGNKLTGSFSLVQNLSKLSVLNLAHNSFSGAIPSSIFTMPLLSILDLSNNHFTGSIEIPNSSLSSRLEGMFLGGNNFDGRILKPISKLINLKHLDLSSLNISYPIDLNFTSSLKALHYLDLSGNHLSSTSLSSDSGIPLSMKTLLLGGCNISEFPNILKPLQNLQVIDISRNNITGKVPAWFWSPPRLISVNLYDNSLNSLHSSMEILVNSSVQMLDLSFNRFEGALPNLPLSIQGFSVEANRFTGDIPLSICNRSSLTYLVMSNNNFKGSIPQCLGKFQIVKLRKNNLEGSIPNMFHVGASLRTLDVGYNQLTGKIPKSFLNCSSLKFLRVDHNQIEDSFPFWLKVLPDLQVLILRSNKFFGPISPPDQSPLDFPELRIFEISDNNFSGSMSPNYFVNWKASSIYMNEDGSTYMVYEKKTSRVVDFIYHDTIDLQYKGLVMENKKILTSYSTIDFSGNRLEGQIPESIGLLKTLIALNLSNNVFTGYIPLTLSNFTELESLDLSRNNLTGTIPDGINTLSFLEYLNVSYNQLNGEIPQGTQIIGQSKSSFEGNAGLCGLPLEETCSGSNPPPTQQSEEEDEEDEEVLNLKAMGIGFGPGVLFGLAICQVIGSYKPKWLVNMIDLCKRKNR